MKLLLVCLVLLTNFNFYDLNVTNRSIDEYESQMITNFYEQFYDPTVGYFYTNSDKDIHEHAVGPENGLYTDYWWEAQLFMQQLEIYSQSQTIEDLELLNDIYQGFIDFYPNWSENNWNDDILWWSLGLSEAYKVTSNTEYLDLSIEMYDYVMQFEDENLGGGIWWKNVNINISGENEKNVATNATAIQIANNLYESTGQNEYKEDATRLFSWLSQTFYDNGKVNDHITVEGEIVGWDWTYNYSNYASAAEIIYSYTNDDEYYNQMLFSCEYVIDNMSNNNTMMYEGTDDTAGFKLIYIRNLYKIAQKYDIVSFQSFINYNAVSAINSINSDGIGGDDWNRKNNETINGQFTQSFSAASSVSVVLYADDDIKVSSQYYNGKYEAENAIHPDFGNESIYGDFSGRGYTSGWNSNDTEIVFYITTNLDGEYVLSIRYSASAGSAKRNLFINGIDYGELTFPETTDWSDWNILQYNIDLNEGYNVIELKQTSESDGFLNLDYIKY